jgi:hypothetical protein
LEYGKLLGGLSVGGDPAEKFPIILAYVTVLRAGELYCALGDRVEHWL